MTKDSFIAMVTEDGFTRKCAEDLWESRSTDEMTADHVRAANMRLWHHLRHTTGLEAEWREKGLIP